MKLYEYIYIYTIVQKFAVSKIIQRFLEEVSYVYQLRLHLFNNQYSKNSNIVKLNFYIWIYIWMCYLFIWSQSWIFSSLQSHDPSKIILVCWFSAQ